MKDSAFIEGRHLLHCVVISNEAVEEARRCKKKCLIFRVDFEKAYDSICWEFLLFMMRLMAFCAKWVSWIEGCLKLPQSQSLLIGVLLMSSHPKGDSDRGIH